MGFFKASPAATASGRAVARLQALTWLLIYGGLLTLVLGLAVERLDDDAGWTLVLGGGIGAVAGFVLIYVRSRITLDS